jgi:hypothetical protein
MKLSATDLANHGSYRTCNGLTEDLADKALGSRPQLEAGQIPQARRGVVDQRLGIERTYDAVPGRRWDRCGQGYGLLPRAPDYTPCLCKHDRPAIRPLGATSLRTAADVLLSN